jgi:hypothetical protein
MIEKKSMNPAVHAELIKKIDKLCDIAHDADWDGCHAMKDIWVLAGEIYHTLRDVPVTPAHACETPASLAAVEDKRTRQNEEDLAKKPAALEARERAGEHIIAFGKHKGKKLKSLPLDYIKWMLGFKQKGRDFLSLPPADMQWIRSNHVDTLLAAQQYMAWRCWACGTEDSRFKQGRLCPACWHLLG